MKLGLELSLASSQPDLAGIPLSFLSRDTGLAQAIAGFGGIYLAFIGFPKGKWPSFSQEELLCLWVGESLPSRRWSVAKLALKTSTWAWA